MPSKAPRKTKKAPRRTKKALPCRGLGQKACERRPGCLFAKNAKKVKPYCRRNARSKLPAALVAWSKFVRDEYAANGAGKTRKEFLKSIGGKYKWNPTEKKYVKK